MTVKGRKTLMKVVTVLCAVATIVCAIYIMYHGLGLSDKLDFGAGAYYYADIPDYQKYVREDVYHTSVPYWVHVVLFLAWGFLMYRLWCRIDTGDSDRK